MKSIKDPSQRDRWARLRFCIIGPLLAAPSESGDLQSALGLLAAKTWRHPTSGLDVTFGLSTLQRWYYAARLADDPVARHTGAYEKDNEQKAAEFTTLEALQVFVDRMEASRVRQHLMLEERRKLGFTGD